MAHRKRRVVAIVVAGAAVLVAFLAGLLPRLHQRRVVRDETAAMAIPTVTVVAPQRAAPAQTIVLPGNVEPYASAPIFARTSGYLRRFYVDLGAHVARGALLAEIETPEVDRQLEQARANLAVAEANLATSEATAKRYTDLASTKAVSRLEIDTAVGTARANRATVEANRANVRQLEQQVKFAQIRAPFAGVITQRNTDVGDLIDAGSSATPGTALFQIAKTDELRVYVRVPEPFAQAVRGKTPAALPVTMTVTGMPGAAFPGKLVRTADAIDPATRTLLVEISVANPTGAVFSGAFAQVELQVPAAHPTFVLPVETLLFRREGLQVATVRDGRVVMKRIVPGRDFGDRIEVVEGVAAGDRVIDNPSDGIAEGDPVNLSPRR